MLLRAAWVLPHAGARPLRDGAILVDGGRIAAVGPAAEIPPPDGGEGIDLGAAVLIPGLVNAHQHGRGISQLLMGYPDSALEPWIAGRRRHGPPDIYAVTRLAAEAMLANGVTATLHANYTYGSGDYEAELRAEISAYRDAGLRATVCIGLQDRGGLVYPDSDPADFVARLPDPARALVTRPAPPPYMADWNSSVALMDRLQAEYAEDPCITIAWGPAGPQWLSDDLWRNLARDAAGRNAGVHFHLLESPAQAAAARTLYPEGTLARLRTLGVFDARTSCAHGVNMSGQDMAIAAEEELTVVLNPGSNMRLFNGPPPVATLRAAGVPLAVGTDNCALSDDEDYLRELRLAALLGRSGGEEAPAREAAALMGMATTGGARALFLPEDHGGIAPGAPADITAFRTDGFGAGQGMAADRLAEILLARGTGADCALTMVAGTIRYLARPGDRQRLAEWQDTAMAGITARADAAPAEALVQLQTALRAHYADTRGQ